MQPCMRQSSQLTSNAVEPQSLADLMHDSVWRAPMTLMLLGANILVFAVMLMAGAGLWHSSTGVQLAWGANFAPATQDGQWWRLVSAMFLHFGVVHLALNMWVLWDVGRLVERLVGRWRFVLIYLASGVLGNLLSLVVQGNQAVSGGASGAIFGLYGALLGFLWRERAQVERAEFRWLFGAASVFTLFTLGMGQIVPGIDNSAHLGGLLAGALSGSLLARPWTRRSAQNRARPMAAGALLVLATGLLLWQLAPPKYRLGDELRARAAIGQFLREDQRISQRWETILGDSQSGAMTFDQLAGSIDAEVTTDYQQSFEQLSALDPGAAAPSARTLEIMRRYAALRSQAAQALTAGLRSKDPARIRQAMESARKAPELALGAPAPASAASRSGP